MGIFGFKTKYDIMPKAEKLSGVVTNYSDVDVIKMNAKVVVPEGYTFIIGKKGKATDFFEPGEYFLNTSILPYMCRKFGIDKIKNGKAQDNIPADFYFVSKGICGGMFKTYRKVTMSTKAYGSFSVRVTGVFSYKVKDVREFMQSLLNEFDYIRSGEAEEMVSAWVSDAIVSELQKKNFILSDIVANSPIVVNSLKDRITKLFAVAGLELLEFKITKYDLPKEYQEESDRNLKAQEHGDEDVVGISDEGISNLSKQDESTSDDYDMPTIDADIEDAKNLLREFNIGGLGEEQNKITKNDEELFGDITFENESIYDSDDDYNDEYNVDDKIADIEDCQNVNSDVKIGEEEQNQKDMEYVPFGDFKISEMSEDLKEIAKESNPRRSFVDLSLDDIYNKNDNIKRCLNCGAENDKNATHCILCGESFNSDL